VGFLDEFSKWVFLPGFGFLDWAHLIKPCNRGGL